MKNETSDDTYLSVSAPSKGIYKEKGSKFLAFIFPVEDVCQVKNHLSQLRKEYFDARHHCFAYRLGLTGDVWRINDDGEPSSTAGRPILGQILSNSLSDILIVVVRYFGGIKLGVPGLINAYRSAASDAISNAVIITKTACGTLQLHFGYGVMNDVMKTIKDFSASPCAQDFGMECSMTVRIRLSELEAFRTQITKAGASVSVTGEKSTENDPSRD